MTLTQAFTANEGNSILVPGGGAGNAGQCAQWAAYVLYNVYGKPYLYQNAINWWKNSTLIAEGFQMIPFANGVYPQAGDFVVWGSGVGSQYGHIDVAASNGTASGFLGYDSNWEDSKILQAIQHNYEFGILGYIRPGGIVDNNGNVTDAGARALLTLSTLMAQPGLAPDRQPTLQEVENLIGRDLVSACQSLTSTAPWGQNWNYVKHYVEDIKAAAAQGTNHDSVIAYINKNLS